MQSKVISRKSQSIIQTYSKEIKTSASNNQIYNALIQATSKAGGTIFATGQHEFYPQGLTAFVILGESHTAIHSFPELEIVWVELASCTEEIDEKLFFSEFKRLLC